MGRLLSLNLPTQRRGDEPAARLHCAARQGTIKNWSSDITNRFTFRIAIELGRTQSSEGGQIEILEVWGTRSRIEVGGQYLVHGKYAMPSRAGGELYFNQTTERNRNNSAPILDLQSLTVCNGKGKFTLLRAMDGEGQFHLQLMSADNFEPICLADVYFK